MSNQSHSDISFVTLPLPHTVYLIPTLMAFMMCFFLCHQSPKSVLISCKDGTVLHVEAPASGKYDTSKTFHLPLTNLKTREYHFKSVKDKLRVSCCEILLFCFVFPLQLKRSLGGKQGRLMWLPL